MIQNGNTFGGTCMLPFQALFRGMPNLPAIFFK